MTLALLAPANGSGQTTCPATADSATELGWAALRDGRLGDAESSFTLALARCPNHLGAQTGRAYVDLREGKDEEARMGLEAVLGKNPESVDALVGLGILAWRRGALEDVSRFFRRVEALDRGNATAADYLGRLPAGLGLPPERPGFVRPDTLEYHSRAEGDLLETRGSNGWKPFYVRGVNLGTALPGRTPGEFPDSTVYSEWIRAIAEMGANTIRVYTIHPPWFYAAIREHNLRNPEKALWLLHGVWAELPPDHDYLDPAWQDGFLREMRDVVDLLHGRADIPPRPSHASGFYTEDLSPWVLGYILGREWEPASVEGFKALHPELLSFEGTYLEVRGGNPMDTWLATMLDATVGYEVEAYNQQHPVSYTNWPTLDPLFHPTETTVDEEVAIRTALGEEVEIRPKEYDNDAVGLDATLLQPTDSFPAGVFATFHAYPYYPDFMALSERYGRSASSQGPSHYFGYLRELKEAHPGMPVLIGEYGVPASIGIAHLQPEGWDHGGHPEGEMAAIDRRLTLEVAEAGMAGGVLFAWVDEWFKRNWLVSEFEIPTERNRFWLNRMDPEQQYGILATESPAPIEGASLEARLAGWRRVPALYEDADGTALRAAADAAYLWLHLEVPESVDGDEIAVGFDTFDPAAGDSRWPGARGAELPVGVEFALQVTRQEARLLVDPPQNPFRFQPVGVGPTPRITDEWPAAKGIPGFFRARSEQRFNVPYVTTPNRDGVYDSLRVITNRRRVSRDSTETLARGYDRGILREAEPPDGLWGWSPDGRALEVRIPWTLLNFTDPSQRRLLRGPSQDPLRNPGAELSTTVVDGIRLVLGIHGPEGEWRNWPRSGRASDVAFLTWPTWEDPQWETRRRPVFQVLQETFRQLDGWDPTSPGKAPYPWTQEQVRSSTDAERADAAWNEGNTEEAERLYRSILMADSSDTRALHRLALIHAWENEHQEALSLFDRLLTIEPDNLEARVDRARVLAWQGDLEDAIGALERILEGHPDYTPALGALAQFRSWGGEYSAALSIYDQLVGISQNPTGILLARAQVLSWASRMAESRAVYDSLLARSPQNLEARLGLARLMALSDETDDAVARYRAILEDHPGNPEARQGLARSLTWGGDLPRGEAAWRASLADAPRDLVSRVGLAQNLRWQGRQAAALQILEDADPDQRGDPGLADQLRLVRAALAPQAELSLVSEGDSDHNRMTTARIMGGWNPLSHLGLRGEAYGRVLEQSALSLTRNSWSAGLRASVQFEPGWSVDALVSGTRTDGSGPNTFAHLEAGLTSPGRYALGGSIRLSQYPLDETAQLVERGVRVDLADVSGRWTPAKGWQVSGSAGIGTFRGEEENERIHANARIDRRLVGGWVVGLSHRYFGFDADVNEFYFDPDYYGLTELTGRRSWEPGRWTLLLEAAPGIQKAGSRGDPAGVLRVSGRLSCRIAPGRQVSFSGGYSSAGLQTFTTGASDYRYRALILNVEWAF